MIPSQVSWKASLPGGDRRLSKAIYLAFRDGARFDSWSEHFSFDRWKKAIEGAGLDMPSTTTARAEKMRSFLGSTRAAAFPWLLWKEYERAQEAT